MRGTRLSITLVLACLPLAAQTWTTFFSAYEDGLTAQASGDPALAARAFNRAIALNPTPGSRVRTYGLNFLSTYHPYLRLAEAQLVLGQTTEAEATLRRSAALGLEPAAGRSALEQRLRAQREAKAAPVEPSKPSPEKVVPPQAEALSRPAPLLVPAQAQPLPTAQPERAPTPSGAATEKHLPPHPNDSNAKPPHPAAEGPTPTPGPAQPASTITTPEAAPQAAPRTGTRWLWLASLAGLLSAAALLLRRKRSPAAPAAETLRTPHEGRSWAPSGSSDGLLGTTTGDPNLRRSYGPYVPERMLGQGGCATTYYGRHQDTGLEVAIKVPHRHLLQDDDFRARFHREAALGALLDHPRIVPILDPGPMDEEPWLVMPFVEGETLDRYLQRQGPLEAADAIRIACDISEAIGHAHSKGVVHRDLKPANVMLTRAGAIVLDFGIARVLDGAFTVSTMFMGTPLYCAPESILTPRVGPPADRYALGIMLYEFLAGTTPFHGESPFQILEAQRSQALPDLATDRPELPHRLLRLLQRLCAKAPEDRPEDGETQIILKELRAEYPISP